ncbi:Uncharacterised protein [Fusobacterium necrogenes]|jgi:bifunctional DNA-binding transcriptional regulator/antitoxin component of YhaV-PrlF toxin-antitoxin module|uniref:SpoVT-AbrB domain-containing protein n=1 Tax=Fusobacterium necrogenes TaxID=858 RepID=A0A377GP46_9FUSO|nr:hypothetical protein [Fusobacterium necrogenes]STO28749.1 Uncharacterised protein [Fusobacterium necrogenes]
MKFDKIIAISSKKQITLPKKVYEELGFTDQVRLVVDDDNSIKLFPVIKEKKSDVLEELIKKGLSGEELLKEFKKREEKE